MYVGACVAFNRRTRSLRGLLHRNPPTSSEVIVARYQRVIYPNTPTIWSTIRPFLSVDRGRHVDGFDYAYWKKIEPKIRGPLVMTLGSVVIGQTYFLITAHYASNVPCREYSQHT